MARLPCWRPCCTACTAGVEGCGNSGRGALADNRRSGFTLIDLTDGRRTPLADSVVDGGAKAFPYIFNPQGLLAGRQALTSTDCLAADLVVIDEIGLSGSQWRRLGRVLAVVAAAFRTTASLGGPVQVDEPVCAKWEIAPEAIIDAADPEATGQLCGLLEAVLERNDNGRLAPVPALFNTYHDAVAGVFFYKSPELKKWVISSDFGSYPFILEESFSLNKEVLCDLTFAAFCLTVGVLWSGAIFFVGLANLFLATLRPRVSRTRCLYLSGVSCRPVFRIGRHRHPLRFAGRAYWRCGVRVALQFSGGSNHAKNDLKNCRPECVRDCGPGGLMPGPRPSGFNIFR